MPSYKDQLNKANPNHLADLFREFGIGSFLRAMPSALRKKAPAVGALANYHTSAVHVVVLPADAKASVVQRASGRAGSVTGEFTPQAYGATPTTGQVAVTPCGDIAFVAADAVTDVDIDYLPAKGDVVELTLPCAASVLSIDPFEVADAVLVKGRLLLVDDPDGLDGAVVQHVLEDDVRLRGPVAPEPVPDLVEAAAVPLDLREQVDRSPSTPIIVSGARRARETRFACRT